MFEFWYTIVLITIFLSLIEALYGNTEKHYLNCNRKGFGKELLFLLLKAEKNWKTIKTQMKLFNWILILLLKSMCRVAASGCLPPCLYLTNVSSIISLQLNLSNGLLEEEKPKLLFEGNGHIRSMAIDPKNNQIYWGDFEHNTINRSSLDGTSRISLFTYAIGYPQGLAVDWSSNILYWTDSLMDMIELSDTNGRYRKVLFKLSENDEPRGIFVNPVQGFLFWTDWGSKARIERSSLSGSNRKTIVSTSIVWPNDLAVDYQSNRLFWVDASLDRIESVDFDGNNRKLNFELKSHTQSIHPYSMAYDVDKNIAYLTDWYEDALLSFNNNSEPRILFRSPTRNKNIGQVRIYDNMTPNASSPCFHQDNQCSHLCLKQSTNEFVCDCPTGMALINSETCEEVEKDYEIYFADSHSISVYHLIKYIGQDGFSLRPLDIPSHAPLSYPVALDYDPVEKYVYWTDQKTNKTYRMQPNENRHETLLENKNKASFGLAIDQTSRLFYWFDNNGKSLKMSSLDGKYTKTVLATGLEYPRDIAIHEEKGYIYFTDFTLQHIGRINRNGSGLKLYRDPYKPISATGLAIDKTENRLYWCDFNAYSIESTDLDFNNHRIIIQKTFYEGRRFFLIENYGHVVAPFSITVLGEKMFWSEIHKEAIFVADKRSGANIEYVTGGLDHPRDIHVFRDKVKEDYRKLYKFSFAKRLAILNTAYCYDTNQCSAQYKTASDIPDPDKCPPGYKETRTGISCSDCSDPLGANFKCPCTDWKTCAQRAYGDILGCHVLRPFMLFKVRECIQTVKPGFCPYQNTYTCNSSQTLCLSDDDCGNHKEKCCESLCGKRCTKTLTKSDHPCSAGTSGCSHFCLAKENSFQCACPDDMVIDADGKSCQPKNITLWKDICELPIANGPCHPFLYEKRWFFNQKTKQCEAFMYGGCQGNENNFLTKQHCEQKCSGVCPPSINFSTCDIKSNSCTNSSQCRGKQLCCKDGCGSVCKEPVRQPIVSKCYQTMDSGSCEKHLQKWFFDYIDNTCKKFVYGGCEGNENNFPDEVSCYKSCAHVICSQPKTPGMCKAEFQRYYYNESTAKCEKFVYGGCGGNDNNFKDLNICIDYCIKDEPNACHYQPCKNALSCTPIGRYGSDYDCTCRNDWIGKSCNINAELGKVGIKFTTTSQLYSNLTLKNIFSSYFNIFCLLNADQCYFNTENSRKKRSSFVTFYKFYPENFIIKDYEDNKQSRILSFNMYVVNSLGNADQNVGYLQKQSIGYVFKRYGEAMAKELGLRYLGIETLDESSKPENKKTSFSSERKRTMILIISLVLSIAIMLVAYFMWKRYQKKKESPTNTEEEETTDPPSDRVHWTFENQLYDELYAHNVTLPTYIESQTENNNTNDAEQDAVTLGATGESNESTGKKQLESWVKFEEETKQPITEFVTADFADPYNIEDILNEPPPDYSSRAATPAHNKDNLNLFSTSPTEIDKGAEPVNLENVSRDNFFNTDK